MRILITHAYSASNAGDGLLVDESIALLREAFGNVDITVAARHPATFSDVRNVSFVDTKLFSRGFNTGYLSLLRSFNRFDLIAAVGGGYLRFGTLTEAAKTAVAHLPQLAAAAASRTPVVYLPQSIGPLRYSIPSVVRFPLRKVDRIYLRDDRSVAEVTTENVSRVPDLALLSLGWRELRPAQVDRDPVVSVRHLHGALPGPVRDLAQALSGFDGYVQSTGAGNDDTEAVLSLRPRRVLSRVELLESQVPRVVVAMRLHAALMALRAGHFVIHLAYERKGFGAFDDLGLTPFVHHASRFSVEAVQRQVSTLLHDSEARTQYAIRVSESRKVLLDSRADIVNDLRDVVKSALQPLNG